MSNKQPSRKPAAVELSLYDQGKVNSVDVAWDNNTAVLRQAKEGEEELTLVLYSSPKYESALAKAKTKDLEKAL